MRKQNLKEMIIFLPSETGQPPRALLEELLATLPAGRAEVGIDLLSGGVEIRLYYDPEILEQARIWLDARDITYDVSFL